MYTLFLILTLSHPWGLLSRSYNELTSHFSRPIPVGKITKKNSLKGCVFVNSALKIQSHIVTPTDCFFSDFAH